MKPLGLYIHIPFCPYRCHYCDFLIYTTQKHRINVYIQNLQSDLIQAAREYTGYELQSVFIGGGTPSHLESSNIKEFLDTVSSFFLINKNAEITIEANPGTLTLEKLKDYKSMGINRVSLGVQTLQGEQLASVGRLHSPEEAKEGFFASRNSGFNNVSIDLMFGFPNQVLSDWQETLEQVLSWGPEHISMYGLQVEPKTRLSHRLMKGVLSVPSDDIQAEMYELGVKLLKEHGFEHYEISNFGKPGFYSKHNLVYWKNEEYLGIGLGAVSYMNKKRFWMTRSLEKYLSGAERVTGFEALIGKREMGETLMLGLRLREGISATEFRERFQEDLMEVFGDSIEKYEALGLLEWNCEYLRLTDKGLLVSNEVLQAFV